MSETLERLKGSLLGGSKSNDGQPSALRTIRTKPEFHDISKFAEYKEFETTEWFYGKQKFEWNLFREHLGVSGAEVSIDGRQMINFSSYNYLDLAGDQRVLDAAKMAIDNYGVSTGSGRMITGEIPIHQEFEHELCDMFGSEEAVVSVGGYSTNAFTIGYIARKQDLIIYDELIHNSALVGSKISGARRLTFPHNDIDALDDLLKEHRAKYERVLVLIEGVYSMDGDIPDVPRTIEVAKRHKALIMVDEAHSIGVIGPKGLGVLDYFPELKASDIDMLFGSMSKSFATCGGYVAGARPVISILKHYAPGVLLYGASPTPANTAAGLASLRIMRSEPDRALKLQSNAAYFIEKAQAAGLDTGMSADSGVVPIMIGSSEQALWLSVKLFESNICTYPMMFPVVPRGQARLRFFVNCAHTAEQIDHTVEKLTALLKEVPRDRGLF
ncbi:MAG: aminotransferase class I/II-fold pyridoxal phosphate-dependent enzyme [Granulosicoccus sp.]